MKIGIIGYGRMGHEIEEAALKRGHQVTLIIDQDNQDDFTPENLGKVDVAIEFTSPDAALGNIIRCLEAKTAVVSGTTGWLKDYESAAALSRKNGTAFIHSSNFSIGVNLLFRLNAELARIISDYANYRVSVEEVHHIKKLDAPSGTAITLTEGISSNNRKYRGWKFTEEASENDVPVRSVREGMVPGIHTVTWDSDVDSLTLRHESKNRKGLALGAVIAAEFINGKNGVFTMNDVMGF